MPGAGLTGGDDGKALSEKLALEPYWGKPAVRNFRGDDGDVGIIRSPVRAIVQPDHGEHFETRAEAQQAILDYIGYYNTERRHSSLGNMPPAEFERTTSSSDAASIADIARTKI